MAAGLIKRKQVSTLGDVLTSRAEGRPSAADITLFDSTGLAIQDLAIARVALSKARDVDLPTLYL